MRFSESKLYLLFGWALSFDSVECHYHRTMCWKRCGFNNQKQDRKKSPKRCRFLDRIVDTKKVHKLSSQLFRMFRIRLDQKKFLQINDIIALSLWVALVWKDWQRAAVIWVDPMCIHIALAVVVVVVIYFFMWTIITHKLFVENRKEILKNANWMHKKMERQIKRAVEYTHTALGVRREAFVHAKHSVTCAALVSCHT